MNPVGKGLMIATAVAALALGGEVTALAQDKAKGDAVKCAGLNECKGKGACKSAMNDCKGKNGCKGKGFVETKTTQECGDRGGKVLAEKK
jgi:uncharacterized membrane protein